MNRNVRSVEHAAKKASTKATPALHSSYMQRFLDTAAHKNLESALQQKINFAFNKHKQITSPQRDLGIDYFDDDGSPNYLSPKERSGEKKSKKKSPGASPRSKGKTKDTNPFMLPKANSSAKHATANRESARPVRETSQGVNTIGKAKEAVGDVSKKTKVKGPNTLLNREVVVELPKSGHVKKIKETANAQPKEKMKEIVVGKAIAKKDHLPKGEKKAPEALKKGKSGTVKAKKVAQ